MRNSLFGTFLQHKAVLHRTVQVSAGAGGQTGIVISDSGTGFAQRWGVLAQVFYPGPN